MTADDISVRPLTPSDVRDLSAVHVQAFPGFFLTALGPRFLAGYYTRVLRYRNGICLGAYGGEELVGGVAGFVDPPGFYAFLRAGRLGLGFAALPALARDPRRALQFLANYRKTVSISASGPAHETAELASIGVLPSAAGRGVGKRLVEEFVAVARDRGAKSVTLTTDREGNDAVNRFYCRLGFQLERIEQTGSGRRLNSYRLTVAG
jgi:ribosomal protein S18 acetylase RimI-like enzyme